MGQVQKKRLGDLNTLRDAMKAENLDERFGLQDEAKIPSMVRTHIRNYLGELIGVDGKKMKESTDPTIQACRDKPKADECISGKGFTENAYAVVGEQFHVPEGVVVRALREALPPIQSEQDEETAKARFNFLMTRAAEIDSGQHSEGDLSPYHARMMLMSWFEDRVKAKYKKGDGRANKTLDEVGARMQLSRTTWKGYAGWDESLFHDGYVFGASKQEYQNLFNGSAQSGQGVDCSTFVQNALEKLNFHDPLFATKNAKKESVPGRIGTPHMVGIAPGVVPQSSLTGVQVIRLCSEKDLKPGDVIVNKTHTVIFSEYRESPRSEMFVIEATGNSSRTVREAPFDPYRGKAVDTNCRTPASFLTDPQGQPSPVFIIRFANMARK
jgi:hypothetical protein